MFKPRSLAMPFIIGAVVFTAQQVKEPEPIEAKVVAVQETPYPTEPGQELKIAAYTAVVKYESGRVCEFDMDREEFYSMTVGHEVTVQANRCELEDWNL